MRRSIKKTAKRIGICLLAAILFLGAYYSVIIVVGFVRIPDSKRIAPVRNTKVSAPYNTELAVVTYNVGFGAYSDDFSFFMDGGEHSRAFSEEAVVENTNGMKKSIEQGIDFLNISDLILFTKHSTNSLVFFNSGSINCTQYFFKIQPVNYFYI